MEQNEKTVAHIYKIEGREECTEEFLGEPVYIHTPEQKKPHEVMEEFMNGKNTEKVSALLNFKITHIKETREVTGTADVEYDPNYTQDEPVPAGSILLVKMKRSELEDQVKREGAGNFLFVPTGRDPLRDGVKLEITANDVTEKRLFGERELCKLDVKLQTMNDVHYDRLGDASFEFYLITMGAN